MVRQYGLRRSYIDSLLLSLITNIHRCLLHVHLLINRGHVVLTVYQTQQLKEMNGAIRSSAMEEPRPISSSWSI